MKQNLKISLPAAGLLGLALLALSYIVGQFMVLEFEIILGMLCFPFVLNFRQARKKQQNIALAPNTYWRYLIWGVVFFTLYALFGITSSAFYAGGLAVFFILENVIGKVNSNGWIYLGITSPFFDFISKALSFPMRLWITNKATVFLGLFDQSISSAGNIIHKGDIEFSVDPECMGLNMIALCISIALVINTFFEKKKTYKLSLLGTVLFLVFAVVLSVVSNFARIILLVLLESMPGTISHEIIGIICMLVYAILPYYLFVRWYFKKRTGTTVYLTAFKKLNYRNMMLGAVLPIALFIISFFAPPSSHVKMDPLFKKIELEGYQKSIIQHNILKLENDITLLYVKPSVNFFGAHHSPLICWTGSGYKINNEKQVAVGEHSYSTGILTKGCDSLYTAWWFDNGITKTDSQWHWRSDMMKGSKPYRLINVSCSSKNELDKQVGIFLNSNLFINSKITKNEDDI
jgi:exosortase N